MNNSKQKHFSLYDAETKRGHSKSLQLKDYKSDEEMIRKIKEMKEEQKEKNRLFKQTKKQIALEQPLIYENDYSPLLEPIKGTFNNIHITNDIDLKLDPNTGNSIVILGSGKRGKSTLMMHIYKKYYQIDKKFISTLFAINSQIPIYKGNKELIISNCFNDTSTKYIKLQKFINNKTNNHYAFLNLFDDVINIRGNRLMNELILSYRNSNISCIISLQYGFLLSKMMRSNCNNIILFNFGSNEAIIDIIKLFLQSHFSKLGFNDLTSQIMLYKYLTKDHGFILINPLLDRITFHRLTNV